MAPVSSMLRSIGTASKRYRKLCFSKQFWSSDGLLMPLDPIKIRTIVSHIQNPEDITFLALSNYVLEKALAMKKDDSRVVDSDSDADIDADPPNVTCLRALRETLRYTPHLEGLSMLSIEVPEGPAFDDQSFFAEFRRVPLKRLYVEDRSDVALLMTGRGGQPLMMPYPTLRQILSACPSLTDLSAAFAFPSNPGEMIDDLQSAVSNLTRLELISSSQESLMVPLNLATLLKPCWSLAILHLEKTAIMNSWALSSYTPLKNFVMTDCRLFPPFSSSASTLAFVDSEIETLVFQGQSISFMTGQPHVDFARCNKLNAVRISQAIQGFQTTIEDCPILDSVTIEHSYGVVDQFSVRIINCPNVRHLCVSHIPINDVSSLKFLQSLEIQYANHGSWTVETICHSVFAANLTQLGLSECAFFEDSNYFSLPNLQELGLNLLRCPSEITIVCPKLSTLDIKGPVMNAIPHPTVKINIHGCPKLEHLRVKFPSVWNMDEINHSAYSNRLKFLTLQHGCKLTFPSNVIRLPALYDLRLQQNRYPPALKIDCPDLEKVIFDFEGEIVDHLSRFDFSSCTKLMTFVVAPHLVTMTLTEAVALVIQNPGLREDTGAPNFDMIACLIPTSDKTTFSAIFKHGLTAESAVTALVLNKDLFRKEPLRVLSMLSSEDRERVKAFCKECLSELE